MNPWPSSLSSFVTCLFLRILQYTVQYYVVLAVQSCFSLCTDSGVANECSRLRSRPLVLLLKSLFSIKFMWFFSFWWPKLSFLGQFIAYLCTTEGYSLDFLNYWSLNKNIWLAVYNKSSIYAPGWWHFILVQGFDSFLGERKHCIWMKGNIWFLKGKAGSSVLHMIKNITTTTAHCASLPPGQWVILSCFQACSHGVDIDIEDVLFRDFPKPQVRLLVSCMSVWKLLLGMV